MSAKKDSWEFMGSLRNRISPSPYPCCDARDERDEQEQEEDFELFEMEEEFPPLLNEEQTAVLKAELKARFARLRKVASLMVDESLELVNVTFAAELAGVTEADIHRTVARGEIRSKVLWSRIHVRVDDLEEWVVRGSR